MNKMCPNCGRYVMGESSHCPNCGIKFVQSNVNEVVPVDNSGKTNGLAITGFVLSLVNIILCCGVLWVPSIIFSIAGMITAKNNKEGGWGLALAGLIISCVSILVCIVFYVLYWIIYYPSLYYYY